MDGGTTMPWRVLEAAAGSDASAARAPLLQASAVPARPASTKVPIGFVVGAGALVLLLAGVTLLGGLTPAPSVAIDSSADPSPAASVSASTGASPDTLVVSVTGAVRRPGLYHLRDGQRIADAVAAAGGYAPDVDAAAIATGMNLAARVKDGDQISVPARGRQQPTVPTPPARSATAGGSSGGTRTGPIELNGATSSELDSLPGIGPVTAAKIIASREQAPFRSIDDLRSRKLVTASTFDKIKALIIVR